MEIDVKGNEGRVIGKGGETIRHIRSSHGVKIEIGATAASPRSSARLPSCPRWRVTSPR